MISIAIDGPAGAGKSTIAKLAAKELSFYLCRYRGTLSFYRMVYAFLQKGSGRSRSGDSAIGTNIC